LATSVVKEFEAGALNAIASAIEANPSLLEGGVSVIEGDVQAALVNIAKNLPAVKGVASIVVGPLEQAAMTALESYVASFIAAHTPAEVEALAVAWLQNLAKVVAA
jgi:hypothetical protein